MKFIISEKVLCFQLNGVSNTPFLYTCLGKLESGSGVTFVFTNDDGAVLIGKDLIFDKIKDELHLLSM